GDQTCECAARCDAGDETGNAGRGEHTCPDLPHVWKSHQHHSNRDNDDSDVDDALNDLRLCANAPREKTVLTAWGVALFNKATDNSHNGDEKPPRRTDGGKLRGMKENFAASERHWCNGRDCHANDEDDDHATRQFYVLQQRSADKRFTSFADFFRDKKEK